MPRAGPYVFVRCSTSIAGMACCSGRLLKKGHLLRCVCHASLRRTKKYASFLMTARALQLTIFEQPVEKFFNNLLVMSDRSGLQLSQGRICSMSADVSICGRLLARIAIGIAIEIEGFKKADPDFDCEGMFSAGRLFLQSLLHAEMHVKGALNAAFFTEERFPNPHPRVMINQCFQIVVKNRLRFAQFFA